MNQICCSFDVTGSMYPCLTQVRENIEETVKQLFKDIPDLSIAMISHGDYCDGPDFMNVLDFTSDEQKVCNFVRNAPRQAGGDAPEAYEAVLDRVNSLSWQPSANRAFVLIGDDIPHPVGYRIRATLNTINWCTAAKQLSKEGIKLYTIQCLNNRYATSFYQDVADIGNGQRLELNQFSIITDLLNAVCFKQSGQLETFEQRVGTRKFIDVSLLQNLDVLAGRKMRSKPKHKHELYAVNPARFQVLEVKKDTPIKDFVRSRGLTFKTGRGFYEFTKPVTIQDYKEVIIQDLTTGDMFNGDKAREILGLPIGKTVKVGPKELGNYRGFIQSTSNNRKLLKNTHFLYEVEGK